jgi:hypothetical protein
MFFSGLLVSNQSRVTSKSRAGLELLRIGHFPEGVSATSRSLPQGGPRTGPAASPRARGRA